MASRSPARNPGRPREFSIDAALEAAISVFAQKGFEGTSLTDLTKAMGINKPSLYAAFGNKGALFQQALARYCVAGEGHVAECLSSETAREGVARMLQEIVTMFTGASGIGSCFVTQGPLTGPDVTEELQQDFVFRREALQRALTKRFRLAAQAGELPPTTVPRDLANYFAVLVQGIALQAQHGGTRKDLLRVVDVAMEGWPRHVVR